MLKRLCPIIVVVFLCGCQPQPKVAPPQEQPTIVSLDSLGDEFQMAPPSGLQELEERQLGKFLWAKCLPPYGGTGEKPEIP